MLLVIAAALVALLAVAHSYLGERYLLSRLLRRPDLPKLLGGDAFTKQTLRFAWHLTSAAWCGLAVAVVQLGASAVTTRSAVLRTISLTFCVSAVVSLVISRGRHLSWVVFGMVAALIWVASP